MGNRKRSPSEIDKDTKRKRALEEIFDIISKQQGDDPDPEEPEIKKICKYKGRDVPYVKRTKG
jgi:hypothetical protein